MDMSRKLWAINGLAVELDKDRRVVADAVGHLPPDGESAGRPAWFMSTAVRALTAGGDGGMLDPGQERARRDRAMAVSAETRNALAQGGVVSVEEVGRQVEEAFTIVRTRFLAVPAKVDIRFDRNKPETLFGILQDEVHEAFQELSGPEELPVVQGAADRQKRNR